ncbi:MAG TPA: hypothetical protein VFK57_15240 [Vicinamibacterales bacterium]|nr:hypothetical protein [Vicinamibacterales bacterium]
MTRGWVTSGVLLAMVCAATGAWAQERRWEVEVYGGLVAAATASDGRQTLPRPGAAIATSTPLFPSREVPSWFFGDGAALLDAVNAAFEGPSRMVPLDPLFAAVKPGRTGAGGVRVRRSTSASASLELAVDFLGAAPVAPGDLAAIVDASRHSFASTFTELLRTGPFTGVVVDAAGEAESGTRREIAATAAFNTDLGALGSVIPYLTLGGGIVTGTGSPSATLSGRYRFAVLDQVPIDESDRVTIAFERPLTFAGVVGGGVRRRISDRWGFRLDVRALLGPDATRVRVSTEPSSRRGSPAGFVESFTNPAIQFSNDPSLGRRSSLSAPPLERVTVFDGGFQSRTVVAFGVSRRF